MNTLGSLRETRAASLSKEDFPTVVVNSTPRILADDANLYYPFPSMAARSPDSCVSNFYSVASKIKNRTHTYTNDKDGNGLQGKNVGPCN